MSTLLGRVWARIRGNQASSSPEKDWKTVGETHRPSGAMPIGPNVPPNYVPPGDEGRPPH